MDKLLATGLARAEAGRAGFAELRWSRVEEHRLTVKNGSVMTPVLALTEGVGVRVMVNGFWGFAAARITTAEEILSLVDRALAIAHASSLAGGAPVTLAKYFTITDQYTAPIHQDPFQVPESEKRDLLLQADQAMDIQGIAFRLGQLTFRREHKMLATTSGTSIEQTITHSGGFIQALTDQGDQRSYPCALGGNFATRGFEYIIGLDLPGNAARTAGEALALSEAPLCSQGTYDLVLTGSMLAHQIHDTLGHALELDRVLGDEESLQGGSFINPDALGQVRAASDLVSLVADATLPGAPGTYKYDDEGVRAQRVDLIRNGVVTNLLAGRESAASIGRFSSGVARAETWNRIPLNRMTNLNLSPGTGSLDNLISGIERGLLLDTCRSFSVDDRRFNFQYGAEAGWLIEKGRISHMVRNPIYSGVAQDFWLSCDGIAGPESWQMWTVANCAKGDPVQYVHVGHGCAPARFRRVKAGAVE